MSYSHRSGRDHLSLWLSAIARTCSVATLGTILLSAWTSVAHAPSTQTQNTEETTSFVTARLDVDSTVTGSIGTEPTSASLANLFESSAFVGPNSAAKTDRLTPKYDLMAVAEEFTQARIRIAALNAQPEDPSLLQSLPGRQVELGTIDESPRISVASLSPDIAQSSALDAIEGVSSLDPNIPLPQSMSQQMAYARQDLPSTERAANIYSERERWCLSTAIYFEARGESYRGQAAVAQVVLNRVKHSAYPDTICGVVFQNSTWRNRCQFSFACDGIPERVNERTAWATAEEITEKVTNGVLYIPEVSNATHYHANYVYPHWAPRMTRLTKIGLHIFYRFRS